MFPACESVAYMKYKGNNWPLTLMLLFAIARVLLNVRAHLHQDANALRGQEEPAGHPSHPGQQ